MSRFNSLLKANTMAQEKFWHQGLRFTCQRCDYCCTFPGGTVTASETEFQQIAEFLQITFQQFLERYTVVVDRFVSIKSTEKGPCIFYDQGCSIYPVRPIQCRTFPFWRDILKSKVRWDQTAETCQGINSGKLWDKESIKKFMKANKQDFL